MGVSMAYQGQYKVAIGYFSQALPLSLVGESLFDGIDAFADTPVLDIKPYVPAFDAPPACRTGWLEDAGARARDRSDGSEHPLPPRE